MNPTSRLYASLCDIRYLARLLAMYHSLVKHSSLPFVLRVLALDAETEAVLRALNLESLTVTQWKWGQRGSDHTWQERCWLMASQWCEILAMTEPELTYLDADLYFFGDPEAVHAEIGARSIAIIPHRFESPKIATNGKYNVSWVTFRGEIGGLCLSRWAEQCREWCYNRVEPGRFGDQKYLDEWPPRYGDDLCIVEHIGAGLAPWNLQQYRLTEGPTVDGVPVCFYHLHEFEYGKRLTNYPLRPEDKRLIYGPYIEAYEQAKRHIEDVASVRF